MTKSKSTNITWHQPLVSQADRETRNQYKGVVLWLTGLPSSGKSTLAHEVERLLFERGCNSYVLDGDNVRHGLNKDLGFSPEDRKENIRRIGEVSNLFTEAGVIVLTAFISPYQADRDQARAVNQQGRFFEIFCKCTLEECERRDPKGLYRRARQGEIPEFTGVNAPYEEPVSPEIVVETDRHTLEECAEQIVQKLEEQDIVRCGPAPRQGKRSGG
ncbi:MAG: adenylyl-sulfate kinase [Dehalococcoidia bacterium]